MKMIFTASLIFLVVLLKGTIINGQLCPPLPDIENGFINCLTRNLGSTCVYQCDKGYVISGGSIRECQIDGTWSGVEPSCVRLSCRPLDDPDNGYVSCNGSMFEDFCTFTCDDGFELSGTPNRTCQSDQTWSGSEVTCSKGQCPVLSAPENGSVSCTGVEFEDNCTITCDPGFVVEGSSTITCGENNTWSEEPNCVPGVCPPIQPPEFGSASCTSTGEANPGDTCTFSCQDGFVLGETVTQTCNNDGTWKPSQSPECVIAGCAVNSVSGLIASSDKTVTTTFTSDNPDALFDCRINHKPFRDCSSPYTFTEDIVRFGSNVVRVRARCLGQVNDRPITDLPIVICESLELHNGTVNCDFGSNGGPNSGDPCTLSCNDGFALSGSNSRTCMDDGNWSGSEATCTEIDCALTTVNADITSQDLTVTATFTADDPDAYFECKLNNREFISCTSPQTFATQHVRPGENQIRVRARCPGQDTSVVEVLRIDICAPLTLENGMVNCDYGDNGGPNSGDTCNLSCNEGFIITGDSSRYCMDSGDWSGTTTVCAEDNCQITSVDGEITSEDLTVTVTFSANHLLAQFECKLNNREFVPCTSPYTFATQHVRPGENQVRVRARCPSQTTGGEVAVLLIDICDPLSLAFGSINCDYGDNGGPNEGDTCFLSCDDGFELSGSSSRVCMDGGLWSGETTVCSNVAVSRAVCPSLPKPANGGIFCSLGDDGVPTDSESCRFKCNDGFELLGSHKRRCQVQNGLGSWTGRNAICKSGCSVSSVNAVADVSGNDATITFTADPFHPRTSFHCMLDDSKFRKCKTPITYKNLSSGEYTFRLRGRCRGQRRGEQKTISFTIP